MVPPSEDATIESFVCDETHLVWVAMIGRGGVADHGWVHGIKLPR